MAAGVVQSVVTLKSTTGLPEDDCQNVFHFTGDSDSIDDDYGDLHAIIEDFYDDLAAGASDEVSKWISESISRAANACSIKSYFTTDFDGSTPFGSPKFSSNFTLGAAGAATQLPDECAVTMSFHGDLTDVPETAPGTPPDPPIIRPAARRRGRIYIGPLTGTTTSEASPATRVRVATAVIDSLKFAATALVVATPGPLHAWSVWSRQDAQLYPVEGGFIDNAFDTQRRRGQRADARTNWPA